MLKLRTILLHNYPYYILLTITIIVTIINIIIPRNSIYSTKTNQVTAKIISSSIDGNKLKLTIKNKEKILLIYYFKNENEKNTYKKLYKLGDYIKVKGEFKIPSKNTTKYLFNYSSYLKHKNIYYIINATSIKKISNTKNPYYKLKNIITNLSDKNPYLKTFILGDKSDLSTKVISSYQENGISHLFAISGMHIALLSSLITKILKKLKLTEEKCYYLTSLILLIYLILVGFSPSILRGVLFYLLFSLNKIYYFYIKPINIFIVILSISLLINYNYIYDIGFWYSFIISFSLIVTSKYLTNSNYLISLLKTSIISFLVSIPISLYNFYQINISSIIYNLFFIPYVSIIVFPLSLVTLFINPVLPLYELTIKILEEVSLLLSNNKLLTLTFPRINFIFYILYYLFIIIFIKGLIKKNNYKLIPLSLILLIHYLYPYLHNYPFIKIIDVGQGDSILLYSNKEAILIDTGGKLSYEKESWANSNKDSSIVKNTTIPMLKSLGIRKIKYAILTHGDYDHMGEIDYLIDNFKVENIIINLGKVNSLEEELIKIRKDVITGYEGLQISCGEFELIQLNEEYQDENTSSQIYYVTNGNINILLTGDATVESELNLIKKYDLPEIDILKVGHHGSNTSTSKELITELNPKYSLISVGKDNKFNHPNKEVLETLKDSKIYRTDKEGTITIKIKNDKLKIETSTS